MLACGLGGTAVRGAETELLEPRTEGIDVETGSIEELIAEQAAERAGYIPDPHGVPSNMFGPVPEEFYGLIGRITMIWPVVEKELHWLHDELTGVPPDVAAGWPFGRLADACEKAIQQASPAVREFISPVMKQVRKVADRRNEIVHSMFPDPTLEEAKGHRPVRPKLREPGSTDWTAWIHTSQDGLRALIAEEVAIMDALIDVRSKIAGYPPERRIDSPCLAPEARD